MNQKQFGILLVVVLILGGAGLLIYKKQNEPGRSLEPTVGKRLLGDFPVNDVVQISVKQGTNEVNLAKADGTWRVKQRNNYPANFSEITDFLIKAKDLKVVQAEKVGRSQWGRLWLVPGQDTNSALVVEFKGTGDKPIRTLLLGKKHMRQAKGASPMGDFGNEGWPDGRYVRVGAESEDVALISDPLANVEPQPEQWISKDFLKVEKVKAIEYVAPAATNSWKLTRETENGEWTLADAKPEEKLDKSKTSALSNPLSSPTFSDVAPLTEAETYGINHGSVIKLTTFDNFNYTVKAGPKTNENYPIVVSLAAELPKERAAGKEEKPEDKAKLDKEFEERQKKLQEKLAEEKNYEQWVYLVSSWTLEPVMKDRSQLLVVEAKDENSGGTNAPPAAVIQPTSGSETAHQ